MSGVESSSARSSVHFAAPALPQFSDFDESITVLVEDTKGLPQFVFLVVLVRSFGHHLKEFFKIDQSFA